MLLEELRQHYGTWADMTRKLSLGNSTYLGWIKKGYIPYETQCVIENKTNRLFKANIKHGNPKKAQS